MRKSALTVLSRSHLLGDGVPTVVLSGGFRPELYGSYLAAVLNRDLGEMWEPVNTIKTVQPAPHARGRALLQQERSQVRATVEASRVPLRVIVGDEADAANVREALAAHPQLKAEVVVLPRFPR